MNLPCGLMPYIQFNLYVFLPVVEMWSRLQAAPGIQLTDLLIMLEADEDFCFAEIRTKHPKNLSAIITLSYSQGKWRPYIFSALQEDFTYLKMLQTDKFMFPNSIK